jgi:MFS family permease
MPAAATRPPGRPGPVALCIAGNVVFGGGLFFHAFLYNFYLDGLHLGPEVMGYAAAALTAGGLVTLLPAGRLVDRLGPRPAMLLAGGVAAVGLALGAVLATPMPIYAAAAIAGSGGGLWRVAAAPVLMRLTDERTRPRAFSWNVAMILLSGAAGFAMAGALPSWLSRGFGLGTLTGLRVALMIGAGATAASVPLFGLIGLPAREPTSPRAEHLASPAARPARAVLRVLPFVGAVAVWMLSAAIAAPFFNIYFARQFDLPVARVGLVFALAQSVWALGVLGSGELATRFGARTVLAVALALFAPAMWGLAVAPALAGAAGLYLLQGLVGPVTNPLIDQVLLARVPRAQHGAVSSWRNVAADLSGVGGASLGGVVLARASFAPLFLVAGSVGLIGALGILLALRGLPPVQAQSSC